VFKTAIKANDSQYEKSIAKARHEKIAEERKEEIEDLKDELSQMKSNAKHFEHETKEAIRELPRDERHEAKEKLKENIHKRREVEKELKREIRKDEFDNSILSRHKDRETHPGTAARIAEAVNDSNAPFTTEVREEMIESEIDARKKKMVDINIEAHSEIVDGEKAVLEAERGSKGSADEEVVVEETVVYEKKD
jgi:hypothetical protein